MDAKTVNDAAINYFHPLEYPNLSEPNRLKKGGLAVLKVISYFTILLPIIMLAIHHRSGILAGRVYRLPFLNQETSKTAATANSTFGNSCDEATQDDWAKLTQMWSLLDAILTAYQADLENLKMHSPTFLASELKSIQAQGEELKKEAQSIIKKNQSITQAQDLIDQINTNILLITEMLNQIPPQKEVVGFSNVGNTCYLNSSLQPLLAIQNFPELVPENLTKKATEDDEQFKGRKKIFQAFRTFLKAWKEKKTPKELGKLIGKLRHTMFQAGLFQGGFLNKRDERGFQDAGSVFELLLYVIDQGFELSTVKVFSEEVLTEETTPQTVLFLKEKKGSVQEKLKSIGGTGELDEPLRRGEQSYTSFTESTKIVSQPPEILVLRVERHLVNPATDGKIDCSELFPDNASVQYELVGFAQNHSQVHWTSVVRDQKGWKYCNDDRVHPVDPNDPSFKDPANYLVYRKIPKH